MQAYATNFSQCCFPLHLVEFYRKGRALITQTEIVVTIHLLIDAPSTKAHTSQTRTDMMPTLTREHTNVFT